jgi:hypothetical protein
MLHSREHNAALDHLMNKPGVVELLDRRNALDLVTRVAT